MSARFKEQAIAILAEWLRVFVAAGLAAYLAMVYKTKELTPDWEAILFAAVVAVGPVIQRWLNGADNMFGRGYVPSVAAWHAENPAPDEAEN